MRQRSTKRTALGLLAALSLSCVGGLLPLNRGGGRHGARSEGAQTSAEIVASWADNSRRVRVAEGERRDEAARSSRPQAKATVPTQPDSLSFFTPDPNTRSDDLLGFDDFDDLLPPPMPEKIREGELGTEGRYGDAGNGRSEGFFAALQEAPDRLRASDLNEVLLPDHLDRLRFTNFPLQAYGAVFKLSLIHI